MSAATLRQAAALMRERAAVATPGPWTCWGDHLVWPSEKGPAANDPILAMVGDAHDDCGEHIASWHPAVAVTVANWLDSEAEQVDLAEADGYEIGSHFPGLVVARAYLGGAR